MTTRTCGMPNVVLLMLTMALILGPARHAARAQTPALTQPVLLDQVSSAPHPGQSGASVSVGWQLQEGRTETRGWSLTGIGAHTTKKRELLRVDASMSLARYRPVAGAAMETVEDRQRLIFTYLHPLPLRRVGVMALGGWRRDAILALDYRAWAEAGVGVQAIERPRVSTFLGASLAAGRERRSHTRRAGDVVDVGLLQTFNLRLSPTMRVEQWSKAQVDTTDTGDRSTTFEAALLARVMKHVGMKMSYVHQYDAIVAPGRSKTQSSLTAGVQITFAPAGAASAP